MKRIQNFAGLSDSEISHLAEFLQKETGEATTVNPRKNQSIFETTIAGKRLVAKQYIHSSLKHRLASLAGQSNADRYCSIAKYLGLSGLPVASPVLLIKTGRRILPERCLYVMERADGEMLYELLSELEADAQRAQIVAKRVAILISRLRAAGVIHRDLNTKNFLLSNENALSLIDFDYASRYGYRGKCFDRRHERDVQTLLSTCHDAPKFAEAVVSCLGELERAERT